MHIPGLRKVHPNAPSTVSYKGELLSRKSHQASGKDTKEEKKIGLTVWRKSLVFNCYGFTVFNNKGDLLFRVDSYQSPCCKTLLMNASGIVLFTIRSKTTCLGFGDKWKIYEGESPSNPLYVARKYRNSRILARNSTRLLARVNSTRRGVMPMNWYEVEGSYDNRRCLIYQCCGADLRSMKRETVAEVREKETVRGMKLGCDVYRLIVWADLMESSLAMAIVLVLDLMFGTS